MAPQPRPTIRRERIELIRDPRQTAAAPYAEQRQPLLEADVVVELRRCTAPALDRVPPIDAERDLSGPVQPRQPVRRPVHPRLVHQQRTHGVVDVANGLDDVKSELAEPRHPHEPPDRLLDRLVEQREGFGIRPIPLPVQQTQIRVRAGR